MYFYFISNDFEGLTTPTLSATVKRGELLHDGIDFSNTYLSYFMTPLNET